MALNWFLKREKALLLQTASPLILKLSLFLMTAVATHLVTSCGRMLIHHKVTHQPMDGKFFRNHINLHHTHYSEAHLVSRTYLGDKGNTTPYFFIPVFLVGEIECPACIGGQGTDPYEQNTQQPPGLGRSLMPQPVHS